MHMCIAHSIPVCGVYTQYEIMYSSYLPCTIRPCGVCYGTLCYSVSLYTPWTLFFQRSSCSIAFDRATGGLGLSSWNGTSVPMTLSTLGVDMIGRSLAFCLLHSIQYYCTVYTVSTIMSNNEMEPYGRGMSYCMYCTST